MDAGVVLGLQEHAEILTQGSSCIARQRECPSNHPSIRPSIEVCVVILSQPGVILILILGINTAHCQM